MNYNHQNIETKWQKKWEEKKLFQAIDNDKRPKFYGLIEFPYPSGDGLHVGHPRPYIAMDIIVQKKRMQGHNVLFPIGFDAFGLPAENYAIKKGIHPKITTEKNIKRFTEQIKSLGISFDWSRKIATTDPDYYKWTQWIFLKMYEKDLAYKAKMPINWCLSCKIGLANEEVVNGKCERCGGEVEKREKEQWMLKITKYADRLIDDLEKVDYLSKIKTQQINWIGRSDGLEEDWQVEGMNFKLKTFTTWPHTTWGATFMVIAPEHPIIDELVKSTEHEKGAKEFCKKVIREKIENPLNVEKKKEGFFIGRYVINHLSGRRMPLYIANFAIYDYGTGIVKCTPTHDQRDFDFAKQYDLNFVPVIYPKNSKPFNPKKMKEAYVGEGFMMNAGQFNDMPTEEAKEAIAEYIIQQGNGRRVVNYKLRDWIFSRQRYWGEPIPMIYCGKCGWIPTPEDQLPVCLPEIEKYEPTDTGESPLAAIKDWVNIKCPKCGGPARRETDVMPNWAGSNWYYLRYCDPKNNQELADKNKLKYWTPVDWYNGGMEHTTLHLLYSRFVYKFLWDIGAVPKECGPEPYQKRTSHGMVLAEDGEKMSKSRGNVVNPDEVVEKYGADTLRMYEMFMGPFGEAIAWSTETMVGVRRFLERVWVVVNAIINDKNKLNDISGESRLIHKTIKQISEDIENMKFNTAVSKLMIQFNGLDSKPDWRGSYNNGKWSKKIIDSQAVENFLKLLAPFAPHLAEELWEKLGHQDSIFKEKWPEHDPVLAKDEEIEMVVQINGKVRDKFRVSADISEEEAKERALAREAVRKWLADKEPKKIIFIKGKLVSIVV